MRSRNCFLRSVTNDLVLLDLIAFSYRQAISVKIKIFFTQWKCGFNQRRWAFFLPSHSLSFPFHGFVLDDRESLYKEIAVWCFMKETSPFVKSEPGWHQKPFSLMHIMPFCQHHYCHPFRKGPWVFYRKVVDDRGEYNDIHIPGGAELPCKWADLKWMPF